jgi:hypothetical protein
VKWLAVKRQALLKTQKRRYIFSSIN